jgi:hypothetical protein
MTIEVTRDIAEALENQFYPAIKENYESDDSCDVISISGTIESESKIDYAELENDLIAKWLYSEKEANDIVEFTRSKFKDIKESFEILWLA